MSVTTKVKTLLNETGHKQVDLLPVFGLSSPQSLSNKFTGERWSAEDLIRIAEYTGCELAFIMPNGEKVVLK